MFSSTFKRTAVLAFALTALGAGLWAGPTSDNPFGLGLSVGGGSLGDAANAALTGEYWLDGVHGVDLGLGGGVWGVDLNADYLWHNYEVFHHRHGLSLYYGPGAYLNIGHDPWNDSNVFGLGVQGKIGVAWEVETRRGRKTPWEIYGEAVPAINLLGGLGFGVGADVGGRYYFW